MEHNVLGSTVPAEPEEPPSPEGTASTSTLTHNDLTKISAAAPKAVIGNLRLARPPRESFPIGAAARAFRRKFFPDTGSEDWNDWRW
jgi:hypothetical protein